MELHGNARGQRSASLHFLLPASAPLHITDPRTFTGNFPIPFLSQRPRTSRNRNSSTDPQYHKTTEDEGEVKDAIPNSARMKRRKVAGHFQAGWENEKKKTDGGSGSSLIFSSFVYIHTSLPLRTLSQREKVVSLFGKQKKSTNLKRLTTAPQIS